MKTRTRKLGVAAAIAATAVSIPLSITAHADPPVQFPDPQGPGCDAFKAAVPGYKNLHEAQTDKALASIPDISTFYQAASGQWNPEVNPMPMLNNGPYVIFAPTNDAFAQLAPEEVTALKADPTQLGKLLNYHVFLGLLGPDDVKGQRPTQEGSEISVTGKGDSIKLDDKAKVLCGGIIAGHARIYLIDTVLSPADGPAPISPSGTSTTSTSATSSTSTTSATTPTSTPAGPAPGPAA